MQKVRSKPFLLLLGMFLLVICFKAGASCMQDGFHPITVYESTVQGVPRGNTIQASITGHYLTVTFTQDIGAVTMELDKVNGPNIFGFQTVTPESFGFYLNQTGDYILTFTLSNGDEYYGEFTVTN